MESDEDVLFENSVLHQHLKSMGVEGIVTEAHQARRVEKLEVVPDFSKKLDDFTSKYKQLWSECLSFLHLKTILRKMETELNRKVYIRLRGCKTLEPDDANFLQEFLGPSTNVTACKTSGKQLFGLLGIIVLLLGIILQRILRMPKSWQKIFLADPVVILTTCCIMLMFGCCIFFFVKRKKLEEQIETFIDFLKLLETFQSLLKKSIRLIQECELVSRGFTFVANTGPLSGLEQSTTRKTARQCPELRHQLFHTARDSMMSLRKSNQKLLQKFYPLSPGESTSQYLAFIPIEDYGPCLKISGDSPEMLSQLLEATDNFSIASLKAMANLWSLQQSEFVRCLAICFQSLSQWPSHKSQSTCISIRRILRQVILPLMCRLDESSMTLTHCYSFQYASTVQTEEPQSPGILCEDSPLKGLFVAVHSLDLHLQSALQTSRALATEIEKAMEEGKDDNSPEDGHFSKDWQSQLSQVKAELAACDDCWAEGQIQSDKLFKIETQKSSEAVEESPVSSTNDPENKPLIEIIGEPIIEDEVFEAYVDDEVEDLQSLDWDEFLTPEEKAKKKKEKEEAKRLLSELKSVISGLAEERKRKEESILRAKHGGIKIERSESPVVSNPGDAGTDSHSINTETDETKYVSPDSEMCTINNDESDGMSEPVGPELGQGEAASIQANIQQSESAQKPSYVSGHPETLSGANMSFSANFAAQVMAKSRLFGVQSDTFGDDDSDTDDNDLTDPDKLE